LKTKIVEIVFKCSANKDEIDNLIKQIKKHFTVAQIIELESHGCD
jgi:hypothetical protein